MGMSPRAKLFAQCVVAAISMLYGFQIQYVNDPLHHGHTIYFPVWISIALTLMWYVGMMNAINFIDGLDGLLSGVTVISSISLIAIALSRNHAEIALVLAALAGGALGFLRYNWNPAKIILGDSGALFIGYVFATVSIIGASKTAFAISLLVPLVVLALPVLDTAGHDRAPHARRQEVLRSGPRAFPPPAHLSLRAQRAPGRAADLRRVRRARRDRARAHRGRRVAQARAEPVSTAPLRVMAVMGTRPDTIKMAPVVHALRAARPGRRADRVRHRAAPRDARRGAAPVRHRARHRSRHHDQGAVAHRHHDARADRDGARARRGAPRRRARARRHDDVERRGAGGVLSEDPGRPRRGGAAHVDHRRAVSRRSEPPHHRRAGVVPLRADGAGEIEPARRAHRSRARRRHGQHRHRRVSRHGAARARTAARDAGARRARPGAPAHLRHRAPPREPRPDGRDRPRRRDDRRLSRAPADPVAGPPLAAGGPRRPRRARRGRGRPARRAARLRADGRRGRRVARSC